ncbi:ABC transporter substrate-binding protein [Sinosporangium siamense]|uniref:ABC transporter substrate-binding protein n=2 Tax=Sinosporangium siamense TaxID=1367973 RepID=A0A919RDW5_9ACTN|nr:ABC transporter substrate-binding protein [Sinosporangium siamense]GII91632.1 ABC transporter substrate-binding protein [Sinosporangium siamense]
MFGKTAWRSLALGVAAMLALSACGGGETAAAPAGDGGDKGGAAATREVTHTLGTTKVPADPKRVVVLGDQTLDFAVAAGIKPVGISSTRGLSGPNPYIADQVAGVPVVGNLREINYEAVAKTEPDMIVAVGWLLDDASYKQLSGIAPTVTTGDPKAEIERWREDIVESGRVFGKPDVATRLVGEIEDKIKKTKEVLGDVKDEKVVLIRWADSGPTPMLRGMQAGQLLSELGYSWPSIVDKEAGGHGPALSLERLDEIDVDHIFVSTLNPAADKSLEEAKTQPAWTSLKAVKENRVKTVRNDLWNNSPGPLAAKAFLDDFAAQFKLTVAQ